MKQNDFYEVDGCTDFIPVKLIEEHKHMTNSLRVELTQAGWRAFVPSIYSFPKINEPQKPVVPKFVADFYESIKDNFESKVYILCLQYNRGNSELSSEFKEWFNWGKNEPIQTLVKMKLYGYTVEKEKLYTVEIPNNGGTLVLASIRYALQLVDSNKHFPGKFTKESIEEAGFGWVFDCNGAKVKEVE